MEDSDNVTQGGRPIPQAKMQYVPHSLTKSLPAESASAPSFSPATTKRSEVKPKHEIGTGFTNALNMIQNIKSKGKVQHKPRKDKGKGKGKEKDEQKVNTQTAGSKRKKGESKDNSSEGSGEQSGRKPGKMTKGAESSGKGERGPRRKQYWK